MIYMVNVPRVLHTNKGLMLIEPLRAGQASDTCAMDSPCAHPQVHSCPALYSVPQVADSGDLLRLLQGNLANGNTIPDCGAGEGWVGHLQVSVRHRDVGSRCIPASGQPHLQGSSSHRVPATVLSPPLQAWGCKAGPHMPQPACTSMNSPFNCK